MYYFISNQVWRYLASSRSFGKEKHYKLPFHSQLGLLLTTIGV